MLACKKENSEYIGIWEGMYTGSDSGIFKFTVDANLKSSGETRSVNGSALLFNGKVYTDGRIILNNGAFYTGPSFEGHLTGSTATGAWSELELCSSCSRSSTWSCTMR